MLEQPLVAALNAALGSVARLRGAPARRIDPERARMWGVRDLGRWCGSAVDAVLGYLDTATERSASRAAAMRMIAAGERRLPGIPLFGTSATDSTIGARLTHPLIFVVAFIAFLGLSDHGVSAFAFWSLAASLAAFGVGVYAARWKLPAVPDRAIWAAGAGLALTGALVPLVGADVATKLSLLPLAVLILSGKTGMWASAGAAALGYTFFTQGQITYGAPYLALGVAGAAHNYRSPRLSGLLGRHAAFLSVVLMAVGTLYWVLAIALVGRIPLLTTREGLSPLFVMRSHLLPIGAILFISVMGERASRQGTHAQARTLSVLALSFSLLLMALLGYRTQVLLTLLGGIIAMVYWQLVSTREVIASGAALAALFGVMTVFRTLTTGAHVGVLESLSVRTGLTLDIYDMMASLGGYTGFTKGQAYLASITDYATLMPGLAYAPRRYVAVYAGARGISMTSTLLGPLALDFGLLGSVAAMSLLGWMTARTKGLVSAVTGGQRSIVVALYALILAYLILGIETGLVDYEVLLLFGGTFLYMLHLRRVSQHT